MPKLVRLLLIGLGLLVAAFLAIQLVPVWPLQANPPVLAEPAWDSPATRALAQRACFDCHSNETIWPLYTRIAPMSWLVTLDVVRGRRALNFSEWGASRRGEGGEGSERGGDEFARLIAEGEMPPALYLPTHPNARLTEAEKRQLIDGLSASLK
jgi:hypothetical protein